MASKGDHKITVTTTIQSSTSTSSLSLSSFEKPRPSITGSDLDGPIFLTEPSKSVTTTFLSRILSRSRFILHLITGVCAFALIGTLTEAVKHYYSTKDSFFLVPGEFEAWPKNMDMTDSKVLLGLGIGMAICITILLAASVIPKVRHNTTLGISTSLAKSIIVFALSLGATIYYYTYKPPVGKSFWSWTCAREHIRHADIHYRLTCMELRAAWWMAAAVMITEFLILLNLGVSAYHLACLRKEKRNRRTQSWMIATSPHRRAPGIETNSAVVYSTNSSV